MSCTIHIFSIEEKMFEVRHEMKIMNRVNEEHSFIVYQNDKPFEESLFTYKLQLNSKDQKEMENFQPDTLYKIPTELENHVRKFFVRYQN